MGVTYQNEVISGEGLGFRLVSKQKDVSKRSGRQVTWGYGNAETFAKISSEFRLVQGALCWVLSLARGQADRVGVGGGGRHMGQDTRLRVNGEQNAELIK